MSSCKMNRAFGVLIIDFAIHTAMRRGELLEITWDMVHIDKMYITLPPAITKTKRSGTCHFNQKH
jgi:integrase